MQKTGYMKNKSRGNPCLFSASGQCAVTKLTTSLLLALAVSGCATPPQFLADMYNRADPCQRPPYADFCGASSGRVTIYSPQGNAIGYVKGQKSR